MVLNFLVEDFWISSNEEFSTASCFLGFLGVFFLGWLVGWLVCVCVFLNF